MKMKIRCKIIILLIVCSFFVGCKLEQDQIKVIAQNSGLAAAVTWIAYDDPGQKEKDILTKALDVIKDNASNVQSGKTYLEVLYPMVFEYVNSEDFEARFVPMALAGSLSILNGIDILFATNPKLKEQENVTIEIVNSFINGAKMGLGMARQDPVIRTASELTVRREVIRRQFIAE
jgi:hypothetical protein